ncbi:MAG: penicillin-binding protein 1A [Alphaproteobacteria bacterium]|nr:penicillin-binding protein 1A [Alphaproteobacteria bacterium]
MIKKITKHSLFKRLVQLFFGLSVLTLLSTIFVFVWFGSSLPKYEQLENYRPSVSSRFYARNGDLLTEYATERRLYVEYKDLPKQLIEAFVAAEDQNFWHHHGIDLIGITRAMITNVIYKLSGSGNRPEGASTITQQVAKNFFLSTELSIVRKIKEMILALRLERAFTKEHILTLYLNKIFLGYHAYGVGAAAQNYFDKPLDQLSLEEMAFLAALPKAPNNYNPSRYYDRAFARRNWVLSRMESEGYITKKQMKEAQEKPIQVSDKFKENLSDTAQYFSEEVRQFLTEKFSEEMVYEEGLAVHTTMNPNFQKSATIALRNGVLKYDEEHGWRGPVAHVNLNKETWLKQLMKHDRPLGLPQSWRLGIVLGFEKTGASIGLPGNKVAVLPLKNMVWARKNYPKNQSLGPVLKKASDVLEEGDIILVSEGESNELSLHQKPNVDAGLVALNPQTGEVLAMVGGFSFEQSPFNRVTQALRQPGSTIKPFVYMTALERSDFAPFTQILDAPVVMNRTDSEGLWKPENYEQDFKGELPLRRCLELSRNAPTVRIADTVGTEAIATTMKAFGLYDEEENLEQKGLSLALGAGETTLLRLVTGYAQIANGGRKIIPYMIDKVHDRDGKVIYRHDDKVCEVCEKKDFKPFDRPPVNTEVSESVFNPQTIYQMVHILKGVVARGTGTKAAIPDYPLAGKTGTSDDYKDAWFVGILPNLAVGVFFGFDQPKTLGRGYAGGTLAAPVFHEFFMDVKDEVPIIDFPVPEGIGFVTVDKRTGYLPSAGASPSDLIREAVKAGDHQLLKYAPAKTVTPENGGMPADVQNYDAGIGETY